MYYIISDSTSSKETLHDDVIKWKKNLRYFPLWGESTGHQWTPLTKASHAEF